MKRSRTKLLALIDDLVDNPAVIPSGWDSAQITHEYLARLDKVIDELVELSVEADYKDRRYVRWSLRSIYTHENTPDMPIRKVERDTEPTETQVIEQLRIASANAVYANSVVERLVRDRDAWLRHLADSEARQKIKS